MSDTLTAPDVTAPAPLPSSAPPLRVSNGLRTAGEISIVVALSLVTFWKSLDAHFLAVDYDWLSIAKFGDGELKSFGSPNSSYRRYAGDLFRVFYDAFGDTSAFRYRLLLLVVHMANAVLAGKLVSRVLGRPGTAWIAAAIFAVAPASAEVIHSIAAFVYPVSALLLLSGLILYDRAVVSARVVPWCGAMVCFGLAAPLREHALAALPLAALLEWLHGGFAAFKRRAPWLRLGTPVLLGFGFLLARHGFAGLPSIPSSPDYQFDLSMPERLLVTLQRLVLPPVPMDFQQYALVHKSIGFVLLALVLGIIAIAPRGDRRRGFVLLLALLIALAPFLPVYGDHVRQRFTYFGTVFAAGLAAFVISTAAERISPRVTLPAVLAILAGLLLEQQAEFERDYLEKAEESRARQACYLRAAELVKSNDDIALFAGDKDPSIVTARSTMRVVAGVDRKQVILIKARNPEELFEAVEKHRQLTHARGSVRLYIRGAGGYDSIRVPELDVAAKRVFETEPSDPASRNVFALLPRVAEDH